MRFRLKSLLALTSVLSLTACVPDGYVEVPTVAAYFQKAVGDVFGANIDAVYLCTRGSTQAVTVYFSDDTLYDYVVPKSTSEVTLQNQNTKAQRIDQRSRTEGAEMGCLDAFTYQFQFDRSGREISAYVYESIVVNRPFDEEVKERLRHAAAAVGVAAKAHKALVPVETTWGLKS